MQSQRICIIFRQCFTRGTKGFDDAAVDIIDPTYHDDELGSFRDLVTQQVRRAISCANLSAILSVLVSSATPFSLPQRRVRYYSFAGIPPSLSRVFHATAFPLLNSRLDIRPATAAITANNRTTTVETFTCTTTIFASRSSETLDRIARLTYDSADTPSTIVYDNGFERYSRSSRFRGSLPRRLYPIDRWLSKLFQLRDPVSTRKSFQSNVNWQSFSGIDSDRISRRESLSEAEII